MVKNLHFNLKPTKEMVDQAMLQELELLKKENAKLKRQIERSNTATAYTDKQREKISECFKDIKEVMEKHAWAFDVHETCYGQ